MDETLRRSALDSLRAGSRVNLELPLRAGDRLGGHVVLGHVDGVGEVRALRDDGFSRVLELEIAPALLRYVVQKGSIALDGVSLTVSALDDDGFTVSLIPETLTRTTLGTVGAGDCVNVEVDILAKHLERLRRCERERSRDRHAVRDDRGGDRGDPRAGGWSSSATTRTARTRATS